MTNDDDLDRITEALTEAGELLLRFAAGALEVRLKSGGSPVTEADLAIDRLLRGKLQRKGEGWLSEEQDATRGRLRHRRVWIVDPLDGTREFVNRIPEWCVSVGLAVDGEAVAGGICNPAADTLIVGARGAGVYLNCQQARVSATQRLDGATVLASRTEVTRGEWERFSDAPFRVKAVGSVAYKMGMVAAGLAEATWTLVPKHEWDVAGGAALVLAAGGEVRTLDWEEPRFNKSNPRLSGMIACAPGVAKDVRHALGL